MGRVRSHFKIHVSIASHRNTAVMWADLECRAIYCELGRLAFDKYAAKTGDIFHVSSNELMAVTGGRNAGAAGAKFRSFLRRCRDGAEALGGRSPLEADTKLGHWRVHFRNFAKKQGVDSKNCHGTADVSPLEADTDTDTNNTPPGGAPSSNEDLKPTARKLVEHFVAGASHAEPDFIAPKCLGSWERTFGRMIDEDGRNPRDVWDRINWLFTENLKSEVPFEIWNPSALRSKWIVIKRICARRDAPRRARAATIKREERERKVREEEQRPKGSAGQVVVDLAAQMGGN